MYQTNVIVISAGYHFKYVYVCELNGYTVVESRKNELEREAQGAKRTCGRGRS